MYAIHTNVGKNRKPLVNALTNMFGHKPDYAGAPTFAYDFGTCKLDRFGTLNLAPSLNESAADKLASLLAEHCFTCEVEHIDASPDSSEITTNSQDDEPESCDLIFALHVPKSALSGDALTCFRNLVNGKKQLICKALGTDDLPIEESSDEYLLPWFSNCDREDRAAYILSVLLSISGSMSAVLLSFSLP